VLLGPLSLTVTTGSTGPVGATSVSNTSTLGPSLLAAIGLTAFWFALGYLTLSFASGNRLPRGGGRSPRPAAGSAAAGGLVGEEVGLASSEGDEETLGKASPAQS
jgi:hypothetical protein